MIVEKVSKRSLFPFRGIQLEVEMANGVRQGLGLEGCPACWDSRATEVRVRNWPELKLVMAKVRKDAKATGWEAGIAPQRRQPG